jgi:hypothetical protein
MNTDKKAKTIEFAPGCFDSFDGTQEELDALQADIIKMFESGELEANAVPLDIEELMEDEGLSEDDIENLFSALHGPASSRNLQ